MIITAHERTSTDKHTGKIRDPCACVYVHIEQMLGSVPDPAKDQGPASEEDVIHACPDMSSFAYFGHEIYITSKIRHDERMLAAAATMDESVRKHDKAKEA